MDFFARLFTMVGLYMGMTMVFLGIQAGLLAGVSYLFKRKIFSVGPQITKVMLALSILFSIIWVFAISV